MILPGISGAPLLIKPPSVIKVQDVFNTSLWTGTGAARTITTGIDSGEGSLVWIKGRSGSYNNILQDTTRDYLLVSNSTGAQQGPLDSMFASFDSTGYGLGTAGAINQSGATYVGWQFRRAEKFFDIVQYTGDGVTGRQIAHNLGVVPGMMIVKRADEGGYWWAVYHVSLGATQVAQLQATSQFFSLTAWDNTQPTDAVFTVGSQPVTNANGGTYIAYIFAHDPSPEGLIQCGSYVGNGSTTGPVVNLGWRPQYLMIKNATATGDWQVIDSSRGFTAANDAILLANTNGAETSSNLVNPNSTGFQLASTASNVNTSGQTYIYMAIREA